MWISRTLRAVALVAAGAAAGCTTSDQEAPALSGPSEFGQSMSVTATPDRLSQDGVSQARVEATVRNAEGKPTARRHRAVACPGVAGRAGGAIRPAVHHRRPGPRGDGGHRSAAASSSCPATPGVAR